MHLDPEGAVGEELEPDEEQAPARGAGVGDGVGDQLGEEHLAGREEGFGGGVEEEVLRLQEARTGSAVRG
ncbi:hypothetical protein GCM10010502_31730 [Kitasatospora aureofaciens]|uniref:Uncharacterized protein n=1 Tax=Kitasatospora aureofaciens TaxID=1894 RepID=A0A8H9HNS9_KITAU|nr:hypothetical protein GCM10010502_31730 [Kitasatospora aureofaciens]